MSSQCLVIHEGDESHSSSRRRVVENSLQSSTTSPVSFSRLPPDVVVSHILPHVVVMFDKTAIASFGVCVCLPRRLARLRTSQLPDVFCFGRFVRDVFRHPWFIFRSLSFSEPQFHLVAIDTMKLITLSLSRRYNVNWGISECGNFRIAHISSIRSIPFPSCLPLLESLHLGNLGWLESLTSRRSFPSLRSLSFTPIQNSSFLDPGPGLFRMLLHVSGSDLSRTDSEEARRLLNCPSLRSIRMMSPFDLTSAQRILDSLPRSDSLRSVSLFFFPKSLSRFSLLSSLSIELTNPSIIPRDALRVERFISLRGLRKLKVYARDGDVTNSTDDSYARRLSTWALPNLQVLILRFVHGIGMLLREWSTTISASLVSLVLCGKSMSDEQLEPTEENWASLKSISCETVDPSAFLAHRSFPALSRFKFSNMWDHSLSRFVILPNCDLPRLSVLSLRGGDIAAEFFSNQHTFDHLTMVKLRGSVRFLHPQRREDFEWGCLPFVQSLSVGEELFADESIIDDCSNCSGEFLMNSIFLHSAPILNKLTLTLSFPSEGFVVPCESFPSLNEVTLGGRGVTDAHLMQTAPYLEKLHLNDDNSLLTGNVGNAVFSKLKEISFYDLSSLSDEFFQDASRFPSLKSLTLAKCGGLHGSNWSVFLELKTLELEELGQLCLYSLFVDPPSIRFPSLQYLAIRHCGNGIKRRVQREKTDPLKWDLPEGCSVHVEFCSAAITRVGEEDGQDYDD